MNLISPKDQQILDAMKQAVDQALERKRRLGQYAVVWRDGKPAIIGQESPLKPHQNQVNFNDDQRRPD